MISVKHTLDERYLLVMLNKMISWFSKALASINKKQGEER